MSQILLQNKSYVVNGGTQLPFTSVISSWTDGNPVGEWGVVYYADVVHNLGTEDFNWSIFDTSSNEEVQVHKFQRLTSNSIRIFIDDNSITAKVVIR